MEKGNQKGRQLLYWGRETTPVVDYLRSAGWELLMADSSAQAGRLLEQESFRVALVALDDHSVPFMRSLEQSILNHPEREWVGLTDSEWLHRPDCARLIYTAFHDFHTLPVDPVRLSITLGHACGMAELRAGQWTAQERHWQERQEIIGDSPVMAKLHYQLDKLKSVDAPVLIRGESGTGKELVARAIHRQSRRHDKPFVAVNCGALPEKLVQSELFGHEKGAFTGAVKRKIGRIEAANEGTIFLDEIGDLPLEAQVNLLRFLQEGTIERVGGTESLKMNVRVIAATHVDLETALKKGMFREDLFYRLNVIQMFMPPLRERGSDIEMLAQYFLLKYSREDGVRQKGFSQQALAVMQQYDWPGNVRELTNRVRRAVVMSEGRMISPADLGLERRNGSRRVCSLEEVRMRAEREAILNCLCAANNNVSEVARQLKVSRVTLYRLIDKYKLNEELG